MLSIAIATAVAATPVAGPVVLHVIESASSAPTTGGNNNGNQGNGNGNGGDGTTFVLTAAVPAGIRPGVSVPVDITIKNPYSFNINITKIEVTSAFALTPPVVGCSATDNFSTSNYSGSPIPIAKGGTVQLSKTTIPSNAWPQIRMALLVGNQDRCQGAHFSLSYTATAVQ
jgi:hypothetical protein